MEASTLKVKLICAILFFSFACIKHAQNSQKSASILSTHPRLLTNNTEKETVKKLIQSEDWAHKAYNEIKQTIDPYVDRHHGIY